MRCRTPQIGAFYEAARVVCLPSRSEPFGIALLEAGAFRRPVVASRVGGIPEIIDDADTGLLVEADDVGALVEALTEIVRRPGACSSDVGAVVPIASHRNSPGRDRMATTRPVVNASRRESFRVGEDTPGEGPRTARKSPMHPQ